MNGIYVIVDPEHTNGRDVIDVARETYEAGAAVVQLRDKRSGKRAIRETAEQIQQIAHDNGKLFIVNDHADIARIIGSDGLHVGQKDLSVGNCRIVLHDRQIIGTSNALLSEAEESEHVGADYLAVGAIFPTSTKTDTRPAGLETLRAVSSAISTTIVAIGGINASNLASVVEAGANSVCVASAITKSDDVAIATTRLVELYEQASSR